MIKTISSPELKEKMENGEQIVLVDCREQNEWDAGHIPGAVFIPLGEFPERKDELNPGATIIIQCRSGARSMRACQFLASEGYEDLANLEGGIIDWAQCGYPITQPGDQND
jgi:rhodanese-related sulfurtransferase